jgi:ligand-binding sensor domain-containing protein
MAVFRSVLYVRNGDGRVDAFDGKAWTRDVFTKQLPRKQVSALAVDGEHLYLAQWGGWSEWDGASWVHHLRLPELQGVPITALLPDGGTMWAGTQGKGIAEVERASEKVRWHGAREGLSDDWVTALARSGGGICAGTFVGGLAVRGPDGWKAFRELAGQNVTALEPDGRDGLFVATRSGLWHLGKAGSLRRIEDPALDPEGQALLALDDALWLGTRTGLVRLETKDLRPEG